MDKVLTKVQIRLMHKVITKVQIRLLENLMPLRRMATYTPIKRKTPRWYHRSAYPSRLSWKINTPSLVFGPPFPIVSTAFLGSKISCLPTGHVHANPLPKPSNLPFPSTTAVAQSRRRSLDNSASLLHNEFTHQNEVEFSKWKRIFKNMRFETASYTRVLSTFAPA